MRPYATLVGAGVLLVLAAVLIGGPGAGIGGVVALVAQIAAVALLRPAMDAPQQMFLARWFAGMGIRVLSLGGLIAVSTTHKAQLPLLPTALGFLAVLLPLLLLETRFLKA